MWNAWCSVYLPVTTWTATGPSRQLTDRFSPPETECGGAHTVAISVGPHSTEAHAPDSAAVPYLWLRSRPMTRASSVSLNFRPSGLSAVISKHWFRSKSNDASDALHGWPPATATPVMVTNTTFGE